MIAVCCLGVEKSLGSMAEDLTSEDSSVGPHGFSKSKQSIHTSVVTVVQSYGGRELSI